LVESKSTDFIIQPLF